MISDKDKCYLWRCRSDCRKQVPYFGFNWVKENREPNAADLMWIDGCEHEFERYGDDDDPKQWRTEWECVIIFNKFVAANKIRIKSNRIDRIAFNEHANRDDDSSFAIDFDEQKEEISNSQYINYDDETSTFVKMEDFFPNLYTDLHETNCTVCIICFSILAEGNVIRHLNNCSGLTFSMDQSNLPILKIGEN